MFIGCRTTLLNPEQAERFGLVFIYRNSSAILIVGGHWRVKCFVLSYKFSSPVATNNTSPMIPDELRFAIYENKAYQRWTSRCKQFGRLRLHVPTFFQAAGQKMINCACSASSACLHSSTHVKISHLVTTCCQAVNKISSHCLFPVVDKSGTSCYQLVTTLMTVTDLLQVCSNKFNIVWTQQVVNSLMTTSS